MNKSNSIIDSEIDYLEKSLKMFFNCLIPVSQSDVNELALHVKAHTPHKGIYSEMLKVAERREYHVCPEG